MYAGSRRSRRRRGDRNGQLGRRHWNDRPLLRLLLAQNCCLALAPFLGLPHCPILSFPLTLVVGLLLPAPLIALMLALLCTERTLRLALPTALRLRIVLARGMPVVGTLRAGFTLALLRVLRTTLVGLPLAPLRVLRAVLVGLALALLWVLRTALVGLTLSLLRVLGTALVVALALLRVLRTALVALALAQLRVLRAALVGLALALLRILRTALVVTLAPLRGLLAMLIALGLASLLSLPLLATLLLLLLRLMPTLAFTLPAAYLFLAPAEILSFALALPFGLPPPILLGLALTTVRGFLLAAKRCLRCLASGLHLGTLVVCGGAGCTAHHDGPGAKCAEQNDRRPCRKRTKPRTHEHCLGQPRTETAQPQAQGYRKRSRVVYKSL